MALTIGNALGLTKTSIVHLYIANKSRLFNLLQHVTCIIKTQECLFWLLFGIFMHLQSNAED